MQCYNCGADLTEKNFCTNCGADVSRYKKLLSISNYYYNDGLDKAGVRDLSGAIESLKLSLKFNKYHIEARNLLGLIYFEMGETVPALSEWVISKNLRPEKNIADDYINAVQKSPTQLEEFAQMSRKYNQALNYCYQDSKDLARIQLKKVPSEFCTGTSAFGAFVHGCGGLGESPQGADPLPADRLRKYDGTSVYA